MPNSSEQLDTVQVPKYRYYTASLLDGSVIMEVPFGGVSWERKISTAGAFSGSIGADITDRRAHV